jgi:hypothetical protein
VSVLAILRKGLLVYVLVLVAGGAWLTRQRTTSWEDTLWVAVHPINGDGSDVSARYIEALDGSAFDAVAEFFAEEAAQYGVSLREPVRMVCGEIVREQPPLPPAGAGTLGIVRWSLGLRWWAWRVDRGERPPPAHVEIYVRYFDPETSPSLAHSLGLQKGLIGVVNLFAEAEAAGANQVVIAHELMHTLGALDRYDPATNQPMHPAGYAEPDADPRHPQRLAEIMAGRIPISETGSEIPGSLAQVVVGPSTAAEIGWTAH